MNVLRSYHSEAVLKSAIYKWQLEMWRQKIKKDNVRWKRECRREPLDFELQIAFVVDTHCRGHKDSMAQYLEGGRAF